MLSGDCLADGTYLVKAGGAMQLWCVCCGHPEETCPSIGTCMTMLAVVPAPDAPAPAEGVQVFGDLAQLMAFAMSHRGGHELALAPASVQAQVG